MVKVIGIAGSPRRQGNSSTLLKAALEGAAKAGAETGIIHLNELTFRGCQGCEKCAPGGECVVRDSLSPVLAAIKLADVLVLASPIYFDGVSGQMKTFFDRCHWLAIENGEKKARLAGKRRAAIIVTYEDKPRDDYRKVAQILADYLAWMGDFGTVEIMSEAKLGPVGAAAKRQDLVEQAEALGKKLVEDLATLG